jgi:hypothetical protein
MRLLVLGKSGKIRVRFFANYESRQEAVNGNSSSLQTKEREAVANSLPIPMHTGQVILLTKALAELDPVFYDSRTANRFTPGLTPNC